MIEEYAHGMLKSTYQKTKRPDPVVTTTPELEQLAALAEAQGLSFGISETHDGHADVRIANKPFRIFLQDSIEVNAEKLGLKIVELPPAPPKKSRAKKKTE